MAIPRLKHLKQWCRDPVRAHYEDLRIYEKESRP